MLSHRSGQPQGIAPTMVRIALPSVIVTTVGAIPCGCPVVGGDCPGQRDSLMRSYKIAYNLNTIQMHMIQERQV